MNNYSLICRLIRNNTDWQEILKQKKIRTASCERYPELMIFNYDVGADFSDLVVCEARGIIIKMPELDVVCWPFGKFNNYDSEHAADIDWKSVSITEKMDGSLIKLYYYDNQWQWATNGTILAKLAECGEKNFLEVIQSVENLSDIEWNELDQNKTYMFELIAPENMVVVDYHERRLYHLATRDNMTGKESDDFIGVIKPRKYSARKDISEVVSLVGKMNKHGEKIEHEGCVVCDRRYHRIKVKSEEYFLLHALLNNGKFSKRLCIEIILNPEWDTEEIKRQFSGYSEYFEYYEKAIAGLRNDLSHALRFAREMRGYGKENKEIYMFFQNDPLVKLIMSGLRNGHAGADMLHNLWVRHPEKYCELIKDYQS